jgi:hypothetical protein
MRRGEMEDEPGVVMETVSTARDFLNAELAK